MKKLSLYSLIFYSIIIAQSIKVEGVIVDIESQTPLYGVNIISGDSGTTSDKLGLFQLFADIGDEIFFSIIGYEEIRTIIRPKMIISMRKDLL